MIEVNRFSGNVYMTTGVVKQNLITQETFTKCGDFWMSDKGDLVQDRDDEQFNLNTGIRSTYGDPFNA